MHHVRMGKSGHLLGCSLLGVAVVLAACSSSSPMSRIHANRALYESWPIEIREAVLSRRVIPGMDKEMVEMTLGKPTKIVDRAGKNGPEEVWVYDKGGGYSDPLANSSIGISGGTGGIYGGTGGIYGGGMGGSGIGVGIGGGSGGGISVGMGGSGIYGGGMGGGISGPSSMPDEEDVVFQDGVVIRYFPGLSGSK